MVAREYGQRGQIRLKASSRNADGLWLCRWCDTPIPKAAGSRRRWCGKKCVDEWRERGDWNHIRQQIIDRDKVCRICGGQRYHKGWSSTKADPRYPSIVAMTRLESGWDVDHIVACEDGGTDDPQNLRLLCRACHKDVTRIQRKLKSLRRRFARLLQVLPTDQIDRNTVFLCVSKT